MSYFMNSASSTAEEAIKKSLSWIEQGYNTVVFERFKASIIARPDSKSPQFENAFQAFTRTLEFPISKIESQRVTPLIMEHLWKIPLTEFMAIFNGPRSWKTTLMDFVVSLHGLEIEGNPWDSPKDRFVRTWNRAHDFFEIWNPSSDGDLDIPTIKFASTLMSLLRQRYLAPAEIASQYVLKVCKEKDKVGSFWNTEYKEFKEISPHFSSECCRIQLEQECRIFNHLGIDDKFLMVVQAPWLLCGKEISILLTKQSMFGLANVVIQLHSEKKKQKKNSKKVEFHEVFAQQKNYQGCCGGECQTEEMDPRDFNRFVLVSSGVEVEKMIEMKKSGKFRKVDTKVQHEYAENAEELVNMFTPSSLTRDISAAVVVTSSTIQNPTGENSTSKSQQETEETAEKTETTEEPAKRHSSYSAAEWLTKDPNWEKALRKPLFRKLKDSHLTIPTAVSFANKTATPVFTLNLQTPPTKWNIALQVHKEEGVEKYSLTLGIEDFEDFEFTFLENGVRKDTDKEAKAHQEE